jgi:hypothetical protein
MEVIGAASAIAGLVTLANQVLCFCYTYLSQNTAEEIQALTDEVTQLSGILQALRSVFDDSKPEPGSKPSDELKLLLPTYHFISCEQTLLEIQNSLECFNSNAPSFWKLQSTRLRLPSKKASLDNLIRRIERQKTTFILALSAYGTYAECSLLRSDFPQCADAKESKPSGYFSQY